MTGRNPRALLTVSDAHSAYASLTLMPLQEEQVEEALVRDGIVMLDCGLGKTRIGAGVMFRMLAVHPNDKAIVVAHSKHTASQWVSALRAHCPFGAVALATTSSSSSNADMRVASIFVTTYDTVKRGAQRNDLTHGMGLWATPANTRVAVFDECHVIPTETREIVVHLVGGHRKIGLSGSVWSRADGRGDVVVGLLGPPYPNPTPAAKLATGLLARVVHTRICLSPRGIDRMAWRIARAHQPSSVLVFFERLDQLRRFARTPPTCAYVCGDMSKAEVAMILAAFRAGDIGVLATTKILDTGFDFPSLGVVVIAGVTNGSQLQFEQGKGRVSRADGNADAIKYLFTLHTPETQHFIDQRAASDASAPCVPPAHRTPAVHPTPSRRQGPPPGPPPGPDILVRLGGGSYEFVPGDPFVQGPARPGQRAALGCGDVLVVSLADNGAAPHVRVHLADENSPKRHARAVAMRRVALDAAHLMLRHHAAVHTENDWYRLVQHVAADVSGQQGAAAALLAHLHQHRAEVPPAYRTFVAAVERTCYDLDHATEPAFAQAPPVVDVVTGSLLLAHPWPHLHATTHRHWVWLVGLPRWLRDWVGKALAVAPNASMAADRAHTDAARARAREREHRRRLRVPLVANAHLVNGPLEHLIVHGRAALEDAGGGDRIGARQRATTTLRLAAQVLPHQCDERAVLVRIATASATALLDDVADLADHERRAATCLMQHGVVVRLPSGQWRLGARPCAALARLVDAAARMYAAAASTGRESYHACADRVPVAQAAAREARRVAGRA